jgi:excisionase family DNA binding protein
MSLEHSPSRHSDGPPARLADDLLSGVRQIADYLGESERRTEYLAERGLIPVFRVGRRVHARKSQLDAAYSATGT